MPDKCGRPVIVRHSLTYEIYVCHLVIFAAAACHFGRDARYASAQLAAGARTYRYLAGRTALCALAIPAANPGKRDHRRVGGGDRGGAPRTASAVAVCHIYG